MSQVPAVPMEHDDDDHARRTYIYNNDGASTHGPILLHSELNASCCCETIAVIEDNEIPCRRHGGLQAVHPLHLYHDLEMNDDRTIECSQHAEQGMVRTEIYPFAELNITQPDVDIGDEAQDNLIHCEILQCLEQRSQLEYKLCRLQRYLETLKALGTREVPKNTTPLEKESDEDDHDMSIEAMTELDLMDVDALATANVGSQTLPQNVPPIMHKWTMRPMRYALCAMQL
ncbi:hypothetical protein H0H93_012554 [Arthromyces matolae]|nr:hypothetical protein H0H93_012554 [Arthromyces matolae]